MSETKKMVLGIQDVEDLAEEDPMPTEPMTLNMGPSHPAMHGTVRIILTVEGETVKDADVQVGYLHRDRPGRPGLALDIMEEFRAVLADRLALTLVNRGQLRADGFRKLDAGGVVMDDSTRRTVITAWQERKRDERRHPFLGENAPL